MYSCERAHSLVVVSSEANSTTNNLIRLAVGAFQDYLRNLPHRQPINSGACKYFIWWLWPMALVTACGVIIGSGS